MNDSVLLSSLVEKLYLKQICHFLNLLSAQCCSSQLFRCKNANSTAQKLVCKSLFLGTLVCLKKAITVSLTDTLPF